MDYIKTGYRDIAKIIAQGEDDDYRDAVETRLVAIKKLPATAKIALKVAFVFSRKAPHEERDDLFQTLMLALLELKPRNERLAYAIARCDWKNWWRAYSLRQHMSLDSVIEDEEGNATTLAELLAGEVEFELKMDGQLDGERIWDMLPKAIRPLVRKRLLGRALTATERKTMSRFVARDGHRILLATS